MTSIVPAFCLVMLRTPFLLCASFQIVMGVVIICSSYSTGLSIPAYLAPPLLQVAECPPPKVRPETRCCSMPHCQVMMLYIVEKASRLTFLAEMHSAKRVADIQQAARDAETSGELLRSVQ